MDIGSAAAFGSVIDNAVKVFSAQDANRQNRHLAKDQWEWQEDMANTAYQRAVADLRAAGLNPALAYSQGGAVTPPTIGANMQPYETGISSALRAKADIDNLEATNAKLRADTDSTLAEADLRRASIPLISAQIDQQTSSAAFARAQTYAVDYNVRETLSRISHIDSQADQVRAATRILAQNEQLNVQERLLAMELVRAQIYQNRESGRYSGRMADQPVISGGFFGGLLNSAHAVGTPLLRYATPHVNKLKESPGKPFGFRLPRLSHPADRGPNFHR